MFFFPEATFLQFSRRVYLFIEQTCFFQRIYLFVEQTRIFQGLSNRYVFSRRVYLLVEQTLLSHRTIEQILIFPETLISFRTHTNFSEASIFSSIRYQFSNFPGASIFSSNRYLFSRKPYLVLKHISFSRKPLYGYKQKGNRYFVNRSRWLLSYELLQHKKHNGVSQSCPE